MVLIALYFGVEFVCCLHLMAAYSVGLRYVHMLLKDIILFAIYFAAGVVSCGGPKTSPRTSSIVHIIFSFWSFEISEGILRYQKFIIGFDSF